MKTTIFGAVAVEDYVRFMELHTRHHGKQMEDLQYPRTPLKRPVTPQPSAQSPTPPRLP
jgi:hypothetical protein